MTPSTHSWQRIAFAVGLLICTLLAAPSWASVIYEYREVGSSTVIGRLEVASPPASDSFGWSTADPSDLIALFLDDSVFGLGTGNLLSIAATISVAMLSLDGSKLDVGGIGITFPAIIPPDPLDPIIEQSLTMLFDVAAGSDFTALATVKTFPSGDVVIQDLFLLGDWTVATVPEPGVAALVVIALAAAAGVRRRRR